MTYQASYPQGDAESVRSNSGWFIAIGIVFIIGGIVAIFWPMFSSLLVASVIGVSLAIAGVVQIIQAWQMRSGSSFAWQLIIGIVILIAGLDIWFDPIEGVITLTLFVALMFIIKGVFQLVLGFRMRPTDGWGWIVGAGVVAILAGVLIFLQWPFSATYLLGTLAGISLIMSGLSYVMVAQIARRATA